MIADHVSLYVYVEPRHWSVWIAVLLVFVYTYGLYIIRREIIKERRESNPQPDWIFIFPWLASPLWVPFYVLGNLISVGLKEDDR